MDVSPERWRVLRALFEEAVELPHAGRSAFMDSACSGDPELRAALERMLEMHSYSGAFVDRPPLGRLLAGEGLARETLSAGDVLGARFRIVRHLGAGGMGDVYEAEDSALTGTRLALKTIRPEHAANPAYIARFKQEIQLLRQITHGNVCRVFDFFPGEPAFFTMELIGGETLAARIARTGAIPVKEFPTIAAGILDGLDAAHSAGVIHRDLKPSNIMLAGDRVVLMDFGIAAHTGGGGLTTAGGVAGTPAYMSPEQLQGLAVTPASDVYSFGVVAFEALTGRPAFPGPSPLAVVARKLTTAPTTLVETSIDMPPVWRGILERCLAHDPAKRFATASQVREALESPARFRWPRTRYRFPVPAALVAAAAVGALAIGVPWWRGRPSPEAVRFYDQGAAALSETSLVRARNLFQAAVERSPGYPLAHARLAQAHAALDAPDLARDALLRAMEARNNTYLLSAADRNTFDGIRAMVTRDYPDAAVKFRAAASGTRSVPTLLDLGAAYEAAGKPEDAQTVYQEALRADSAHPTVHLRLAELESRRQRLAQSLEHLDRAQAGFELLGLSEAIAETWLRRGQAYLRLSRFAQARQAAEAARGYAESNRLAAHRVRALFTLSAISVGAGEMERAREYAASALDIANREKQEAQIIVALNDLAFAHLTQFRMTEAARLAEQALALAERHRQPESAARAKLNLMNVLFYQSTPESLAQGGKLGEDVLAFARAAGVRKLETNAQLLLARMRVNLGDHLGAAGRFREAGTLARALGDAGLVALAEQGQSTAYQALGRLEEAAGHAAEAVAAYRSNRSGNLGYALLNQSGLLRQLGRTEEAIRAIEEAHRMAAENPRLRAHADLTMAEGLVRIPGQTTKAAEALARSQTFRDDESPAWRLRTQMVRVFLKPAEAASLCRTAASEARSQMGLHIRTLTLQGCAEVLGRRGGFLLPGLKELAGVYRTSGNTDQLRRTEQAIGRIEGKETQE